MEKKFSIFLQQSTRIMRSLCELYMKRGIYLLRDYIQTNLLIKDKL